MCGRFTLTTSAEVVAEFFELADLPELTPRYNIAPSQPVPAVLLDGEHRLRRLDHLRWGLVPFWAKDPAIGYRMINARSDGVENKPAFRAAFKKRRCLVAADGFYEWQKQEGSKRKQPYYIRMTGGGVFAFAGLGEHWESPDGAALDTCTILTTEPNALMKPLHDRMPVILPRESFAAWLDPAQQTPDPILRLLRPFPAKAMSAFPVSTTVNNPANDTPACLEPLT